VRSNRALMRICLAYGIPLVSGKDSMKNDYGAGDQRISVPPTLLFTALATLPDVSRALTLDAKRPGDIVYVLGTTRDECGASEWYAQHGYVGTSVPRLANAAATYSLYTALHAAARQGLVRSAHDCSDGGLGVALAESAMAGRLGIRADLDKVPTQGVTDSRRILWSESLGRLVVTVRPEDAKAFETVLGGAAVAIGEVLSNPVVEFFRGDSPVLSVSVEECLAAWKRPFGA
jgi:phosphoribosylformylglycinamidine synthase subunit PurSL